MAIIPFHIVDAFAERPFTGNPAAIIPNAATLTEAEMLQITDELSMEAGFVLPPESAGADVRLRFFTKRREAILSGHVVIAAFASMADRGFYKPHPDGLEIRLETGAGILPVTLTAGEDGRTHITLRLPDPRFGEPVPAGEVAAALDLPAEYLRIGDHGPHRVSCGFDQIIVPVNERNAIRGVFRDMERIGELTDRRGVGGITLFCPDTYSSEADFHCRFFHPRVGADEDLASGTSLGAVAAYLVDRGLVPLADKLKVVTEQGHSLGRPTRAEIHLKVPGGRITAIDLVATGAVVMRGSFHFNRRAVLAAY
ncbi:MAG: PhzF family phenazine biosynthesis protein [Candidatus Krumholzibacteriota bacterium]